MLNGYIHPDFSALEKTLKKQLPKNKEGGAALCVYHHGEKVVDVWSGTKNAEGDPWEEDTVAISFSTTKGISATLLHIIVAQGLADYDDPIAKHWPEFAANGKEKITIRQALCHTAGLYLIDDHIEAGHEVLDWEKTKAGMAAAKPDHKPGKECGYHALNFGHLMGGIIEGATGKSFQTVLQESLVEPLGLEGCFIGLPEDQLHRRAHLTLNDGILFNAERFGKHLDFVKALPVVGPSVTRLQKTLLPGAGETFDWNDEETVKAIIPAATGMFTARSLARIYAMLANGGELDGVRLISQKNMDEIGEVQHKKLDRVMKLPMHWRMGYHRLFAVGASAPRGFAHFGFGGSGACCDPDRNISVAMTVNSNVGNPLGDARFAFMAGAALRCADKRKVRAVAPAMSA